jgi:hypothetical protein
MKLETGLAWGFTVFALIAMTDIPAAAPVGAAFGWLIFVAVMLLYGPSAFKTVTAVNTGTTTPPVAGLPIPTLGSRGVQ